MRYVTPKIRRCRKNGKVRYLRQGRELRDQGFPLPPPFQPDLEGECPPCQGGRRRDSVPCQRVYTVPPFRQGHARGINCVCWKSSAWQGFFLLTGGFRACPAGRFLRAIHIIAAAGRLLCGMAGTARAAGSAAFKKAAPSSAAGWGFADTRCHCPSRKRTSARLKRAGASAAQKWLVPPRHR